MLGGFAISWPWRSTRSQKRGQHTSVISLQHRPAEPHYPSPPTLLKVLRRGGLESFAATSISQEDRCRNWRTFCSSAETAGFWTRRRSDELSNYATRQGNSRGVFISLWPRRRVPGYGESLPLLLTFRFAESLVFRLPVLPPVCPSIPPPLRPSYRLLSSFVSECQRRPILADQALHHRLTPTVESPERAALMAFPCIGGQQR